MQLHLDAMQVQEVVIAGQALTVLRSQGEPSLAAALDDNRLGEAVQAALREIAPDVDVAGLDPDADLSVAADLDSIDFLALVVRVEQRTGVAIPERDFPSCTTLGGLTAYIRDRTLARHP